MRDLAVLPVNNGDVIKSCLFMYDNDNAAHTTAYPAHKILTEEGHEPFLYIFESVDEAELGGHRMPVLGFEWINRCLGIFEECSSTCAAGSSLRLSLSRVFMRVLTRSERAQ